MLATVRISRRPDPVTVCTLQDSAPEAASLRLGDGIEALIAEREGTTVIVTIAEAERRDWSIDFRAVWLTVEVHSALEAVGLTQALSTALAKVDIPANVIAGFFHDHILVPLDRADDAIAALEELATSAR